MVIAPIQHIRLDERGIAFVVGTALKVADIAIDTLTWKMTPLEIQDNYPLLSLAQIHTALAYYYDNASTIDAQIAQSMEEYKRLRAEFSNALTREQFTRRLSAQQQPE